MPSLRWDSYVVHKADEHPIDMIIDILRHLLERRRIHHPLRPHTEARRHPPRRTRRTRPDTLDGLPSHRPDRDTGRFLDEHVSWAIRLLLRRLVRLSPPSSTPTNGYSILHFILFVWACVDTHRRNTSRSASTLALAMQLASDQQAARQSAAPPYQAHPSLPPNMVMVNMETLQQMNMAHLAQHPQGWQGMSPQQQQHQYMNSQRGSVSPVTSSPQTMPVQLDGSQTIMELGTERDRKSPVQSGVAAMH